VCHTRKIPAPLGVVLTGFDHHVLTSLPPAPAHRELASPPRTAGPDRPPAGDLADLAPLSTTGVAHFRAEAFRRLDAAAFARLDGVYARGLDAACNWLSTCVAPDRRRPGGELVQWFLTGLVHDSPSRGHTLALLRGAQAGFLSHGLLLGVPLSRDLLDVLSGPGLNGLPVTAQTVERIRAGVANPMVAAGVATALLTGISPRGTNYAHQDPLSPDLDALYVAWGPSRRTHSVVAATITTTAPTVPTMAVFYVPAPARALLRAASTFATSQTTPPRRQLFAETIVTNELIRAAADNCQVTLPAQPPPLVATWQIRVTCAPIDAPPVHTPGHCPAPEGQLQLTRICDQLSNPAPTDYGHFHAPVTGREDGHSYGRRPLLPEAAAGVLELIHDHLNAVPAHDRHKRSPGRTWTLIRRQLARYARDPGGHPTVPTPHPDVLFALRLTDRPAEITAADPGRSFVRHEDQ
jgi:hypothetical protein